ncbi:MAG TPA: DUF3991 and TOPRIM domain-containing protein [Terracidiphilus sp.]|jgi:hypothetical protein
MTGSQLQLKPKQVPPRNGRSDAAGHFPIPGASEGKRAIGKEKGVLTNLDTELDAFKREIDMRQFAVSLGYEMDRRESWRGSTVLRSGSDKIVVKRNGNGHYVFFSVRDDRDNGTVIDFLQRREHLSLGTVRQTLRPWLGRSAIPSQFPKLEPTTPDRMRVESEYRRMADALRHPYLEHQRRLPASLLSSSRFAGRVRIDRRGNAVFPHFDITGLCGYEIKNQGFTGFASGGKKGLWFSHTGPSDKRLVVAESAIDALSHAVLFPDAEDRTRYASLGGKPNAQQPGLVQATIARLPEGAEIVAAFDADEAGLMLVRVVRLAVASVASRTGTNLIFLVHLPAQDGDDWNQVLQRAAAPEHRQDKTKFVQGEVREVDRQRLGVEIQTK